ncbi:14769_t:CDS:2, partial [Gigaspora margarita]
GTIGARENQETEELTLDIEPRTKLYIDSAIQAATMSLMQQMQQFITQQAETQCEWNAQVLESINQKLVYRELANINETAQGNYPSTLVINSLLLTSGTEDRAIELAVNNETVSYKATGRKFLSFVYTFKDNTQEIQGVINEKAIKTEQIHLCLSNKIWKTIALGLFADLQKFAQKNLMNNVKAMNEDTVLQTSEDGVVMIKKQKQSTVIKNISDWLIAFKAYMDTIFTIYGNCKSELNTYRDQINELCTKYKFSTVMAYDENQKIALVINRDLTLIKRDIKAEEKKPGFGSY